MRRGFTILEIMIVLAIVSVLLTLSFLSLSKNMPEKSFNEFCYSIYSDIQSIRLKSLFSTPLFLDIHSDKFIVHTFEDKSNDFIYNPSEDKLKKLYTINIPKNITLTSSTKHVFFDRKGITRDISWNPTNLDLVFSKENLSCQIKSNSMKLDFYLNGRYIE